MTESANEGAPPLAEEDAREADAGSPRESGPDATRDAMASPDPFRLTEEQLDERDERFTGPRKEQGPPLAGPDAGALAPADEAADDVEETPVPEPPD